MHLSLFIPKAVAALYLPSLADLTLIHMPGTHHHHPFHLPLSGGRSLAPRAAMLVMGILNVTPDSFSDGGTFFQGTSAVDHAMEMLEQGADVIDVGGESTRPGAELVDVATELERVIPVIVEIRRRSDVAISVDTRKAAVARAALESGADMVNDVSALRTDPALADVVRDHDVPVILMHMRGEPESMQTDIHFSNLMGEISQELTERVELAVSLGIPREKILVDPGIGFGKTFDQNLEILARAGELSDVAPVVLGASRKAFIGKITGREGGAARAAGSLAAVASARLSGAAIVRVHDVAQTVDFLKVFDGILAGAR
ncbi:MAG: dihydropteroate synthase [Acidobacteriota bacterium]